MSNRWFDYKQNFKDNLPPDITYRDDISRFIFLGRRFAQPWQVIGYRNYLIKTGNYLQGEVLRDLFGNDELGFLLTASPETCFTDLAGTTQAGPGDPVAYWQDLSGNDNHATQPTTANRPILGRKPEGGALRHVLRNTSDLDNAYWDRTNNAVITDLGDGVIRFADQVTETTVSFGWGKQDNIFPSQSSLLRQCQIEVKPENSDTVWLSFNWSVPFSGSGRGARFSLQGEGERLEGSDRFNITPLDDGWYRITVDPGVNTTSSTGRQFMVYFGDQPEATDIVGTGNRSLLIRRPQIRIVDDVSDDEVFEFQSVGETLFDVTEEGKPDRYYLFFGGASDPRWMQTPVITPGTNRVQVFVGLRKLSDADTGFVLSTGNSLETDGGTIHLAAPGTEGELSYRFRAEQNNSFRATTGEDFIAPHSGAITGLVDPVVKLRVNGLQVANSSSSYTTTFAPTSILIGRRVNGDLFFNGEISALTTRFGPNLDNNQIELVEKFTAAKVPELTKPVIDGVPTIGVS